MRLPGLATIDASGAPSARTVVLRAADGGRWVLRFHTDGRSAKAAEIEAAGRVACLFYDPVSKVQLRATGRAEIHRQDGVARAAWATADPVQRRAYLAVAAPGTPASGPTSGLPSDPLILADQEKGLAAFTVIDVQVERLEWLHLDGDGHRKAVIERREGKIISTWLVP